MASKQQAGKRSAKTPASASFKPGQSSPPMGSPKQATAEKDEHYDLVSVLYHALQGAETVSSYIDDAERAHDEELVEFFEETRGEYVERARKAKELLSSRLSGEESEEEEEEEEEEDELEEEDED